MTATIASNIAAVSATDMRSTLLVDADLEHGPVASILRLASSGGVTSVLSGQADLVTASVQAPVGRDRWLDVVPSGARDRGPITSRESETLRNAIARAARHYELTVIVAPLSHAADVRVGPEVLVCAHVAHSLVSVLRSAVAALRDEGAQIIGIALWSADAPNLDPPWIFESWFPNERSAQQADLAAADH